MEFYGGWDWSGGHRLQELLVLHVMIFHREVQHPQPAGFLSLPGSKLAPELER